MALSPGPVALTLGYAKLPVLGDDLLRIPGWASGSSLTGIASADEGPPVASAALSGVGVCTAWTGLALSGLARIVAEGGIGGLVSEAVG